MKRWLLLLVGSVAFAQESQINKAIRMIEHANNEIFIIAPTFRVMSVAQATINALAKRGVRVYGLTTTAYVLEPASYWWNLEIWGAKIRTINSVYGYQMIVDGRHLINGSEFALGYDVSQTGLTIITSNEALNACLKARDVWKKGIAFNTENLERQRRQMKLVDQPITSMPCSRNGK